MHVFAPLSAAMLVDPYRVYEQFRQERSVHWHEQLSAWLVFGHAECVRLHSEPGTFTTDLRVLDDHRQLAPRDIVGMQNLDPPELAPVRQLVIGALRPLHAGPWLHDCIAAADKLLGELDLTAFDFVREVSQPLALSSMRLLFGVPHFGDAEEFHAAQQAVTLSMDAGLEPERNEPGVRARRHLTGLLDQWLRHRPASGALSGLDISAMREPRRSYLINSLRSVLVAGYGSASSMLTNAVHVLARAGLLDQEEPLPMNATAYHELVRHSGPVQVDGRACARDTVLDGQPIRRGDEVLAVLASANRDPHAFERPADIVLGRSPNPHLGFGRGVHACVGANLALTLHVAVLSMLSRRYRVTLAGDPTIRPTATLRGFSRLPLTARPR